MAVHSVNEGDLQCSCGETHKGHICWLAHMGLLAEVYHLTSVPKVSCSKCGAKANLAHNVCFPMVLRQSPKR